MTVPYQSGESTFADYCLTGLRSRGADTVFVHGERRISGNDAVAMVHRIARELRSRGIGRGDGVCVLASNRPEAFLTQVAIQMLGARHTGLHPMGSVDDHLFIVQDSGASLLVYDPGAHGANAAAIAAGLPELEIVSLGEGEIGEDLLTAAARQDATPVECAAVATDVCSVFYTGGTTGRPKGVVHTHRNVLFQAVLVQANWQLPASPVLLVASPITHAGGQIIAPVLALGGKVVLVDGFNPAKFLGTIERERVSVTFMVPTMIYGLLDHPDIAVRDLSSLRTLVYGAASIAYGRLEQALEVFGDVLFQGYGLTEIGVGALLLRKEDHRTDLPSRLASAGRPPAGVVVSLRDDVDTEVPVGVPGEICLKSTSVMAGYWKQPELTAEVLRGGWLHTGDVGVADADGFVTIVDRKKDMVVTGGFNVYPREVEDALHEHPAVELAAVVGIDHPKWGEAIHAMIKLVPGREVEAEELRQWVRERKGPISVPKSFEFVSSLPVTSLGKIDKKAIRRTTLENAG